MSIPRALTMAARLVKEMLVSPRSMLIIEERPRPLLEASRSWLRPTSRRRWRMASAMRGRISASFIRC